uniref:Secreted protein n=2 Tax=Macrostomum lignano TaxID=282301 RepID=A0A1I8HMK4_9PLAT
MLEDESRIPVVLLANKLRPMSRFVVLSLAALLLVSTLLVSSASAAAAASGGPPSRPSAASSARQSQSAIVEDENADDSAILPLEYFPLMEPHHRCLFVCRYCYQHNTAGLLHCANNWCLARVKNMLELPRSAYRECPAMGLVDLAGRNVA